VKGENVRRSFQFLLFFPICGFLHFMTSVHFVVSFFTTEKEDKYNSSYVKPSATADGTDLCDQPLRKPPKGGTPNDPTFTIHNSPLTINSADYHKNHRKSHFPQMV
jgi:hypothetical protein